MSDVEEPVGGLSRRQVLTRTGIGVAVAWATPAILSFPTAAAAGSPKPPDAGMGCVTITVLDKDNAPLAGVDVTITNGTFTATATTGSDGVAHFPNVPPGVSPPYTATVVGHGEYLPRDFVVAEDLPCTAFTFSLLAG
jgi:hypothetical protein